MSTQRALIKHSENTQREIREQSESIKIRVNTVGAFKYCVLFQHLLHLHFIVLVVVSSQESDEKAARRPKSRKLKLMMMLINEINKLKMV